MEPAMQPLVESLCLKEGICLCSGRGKTLKLFVMSFKNYLRTTSQLKHGFKDMLKNGFVVVKFFPAATSLSGDIQ
eukprot:305941-Amphidinium_carterae.1